MTPGEIVAALALKIRERRLSEQQVAALLAGFTAEALTTTVGGIRHEAQFRFLMDLVRWIVVMCSRRAGKTDGLSRRWARNSMAKPGGNRVYLALTAGQAREIIWEPYWKPLCAQWGLCTPDDHNETRMITVFPNGSRVRFTGSDDIKSIKKELGAGLDEACVDEGQDQPDGLLTDLCDRILSNAMTDKRGTLIVMGVVPEVQAGYFWRLWAESKWSKHNFSQMENPFLPHAMEELLEYLERNPGYTIDSPIIQRERFGKFVFDKALTAYTYSPAVNGYDVELPDWFEGVPEWMAEHYPDHNAVHLGLTAAPISSTEANAARFGLMASKPHPGIDRFSCSVDQGRGDRVSLNVIGWGATTHEVQHVMEWSSPRKASLTMRQIVAVMALAAAHFEIEHWSMDGTVNEIDTLGADYGVGVVRAPLKADLPGQVRRANDLMTKGWAKVMKGSAVEEDFTKARWDKDARSKGQWKWATQWHPDPSESWRYALSGYYASYEPAKPTLTPEQEARAKAVLGMARRRAAMSGHVTEEDEEMQYHQEEDQW